jgi:hypothetical protein
VDKPNDQSHGKDQTEKSGMFDTGLAARIGLEILFCVLALKKQKHKKDWKG